MPRTPKTSDTSFPADHSPSSGKTAVPDQAGRSFCDAACRKGGGEVGQVTPTRENYLKFILLEERANGCARACNLAELLGVTRSTVATTFRELKADGLIDYAPYSPIRLTDKGRELAERIVGRYEAVRSFFSTVLDVDAATSSRIACELEHVLTDAVVERLRRFAAHADQHRSFWERNGEGSGPSDGRKTHS